MRKRSLLSYLTLGLFLFAIAIFSIAPKTSAQAVTGTITGSVTDTQGAAVAGAKVTITNLAKGTVQEVQTNESGNYTVTHLLPDAHKVHIEAPGFKAYDVPNVQVGVDATVRVDAQMQVGAVTQSIEVSGEVPQLQTEKSDVAATFDSRTVENLPIYNRNFTTLQLLTPGNQRMNGWNHAASENPQGSQQIITQGQHFAGTGFELDGTDNQDPILGIIVINPNLEAINEVKVTSQDYDAEFGKAIGVIMTTQTKSGTNTWHGGAFDFQRSNSNFARNPFTQAPVATPGVPSGNWNQFGGTIGGPIKKDKIFIFGDYQGTRSHIGGSGSERVPTSGELTGDFSDLATTALVYDPFMTTDAAHTTVATDASGNPIFLTPSQRTQANCPNPADFCGVFPGNIIPAARLTCAPTATATDLCHSAVAAQALLKEVNAVGAPTTTTSQNFFGAGNNVLNADNFDVRGDISASAKMQIYGRYSYQKYLRAGPGLFGTLAGGKAIPSDPSQGDFAGSSKVKNQSVAAGVNYTFSPTLLADFRFGWFTYHVDVTQGGFGTTPAQDAGANGLNLSDKTYTSGMPYFASFYPNNTLFAFGYALGAQSEGHCNCPLKEQEYQYQFVNNWTKIKSNHQIKFGADLRYAHNLRVPSDAHRAGELQFTNDITQGVVLDPKTGKYVADGGIGFAGFLLGTVSNFRRYVSSSTNATETQPRFFFYGQDTWRATAKLTVNFGLRWEIWVPEAAAGKGLGGWIDLNTGEVRVANELGVNLRGNTSTSYAHLAPRVGFAYQLNSKTVVRMGYGRSYDIGVFGSIFGHAITQNLPVLGTQSLNPPTGSYAFTLAQGPPTLDPATALGGTLATSNCNPITDPTGIQPDGSFIPDSPQCVGVNGRPLQPNNIGGKIRPFNNRLPTVDAWNVTVQHQLTSTITASAAYVGNKGTHTFVGDNPSYNPNNQTVVGYCPPGLLASQCPNGAISQNLRKPYYSKYGWTQGFDYYGNDANSEYEALQITVEKRFSQGLSMQGSYTFQHATNDDPNYYNIDKAVMHGPSNDYRNSVFILTEVYQLPFGKGKKWGADAGRALNFVIGGWSLNTITNFSSGLPFNYGLNSCQGSNDTGPCRPDIHGVAFDGTRSGSPTAGGYWFKTTGGVPLAAAGTSAGTWAQPAIDTFGDVGRNAGRGPKFFNIDLALFKDFTITERANLQFQFQTFNVLNHVNLDLPNGCVDCNNGGSITNISYGSQMRAIQFGLKLNF